MKRLLACMFFLIAVVGCKIETSEQRADREFRRDAFNRLNKQLSVEGQTFQVGSEAFGNVAELGRAYCGVANFSGHSEGFVVTEQNVVMRHDRPDSFDAYFKLHCPS